MSRSRWKPYKIDKAPIQHRSNIITPYHLAALFTVHNGKENKQLMLTIDHVGHKFGEFIPTKIIAKYTKNVK